MAKITTNTPNGNITITPNGTGEVDISKVDIDGGTIDGTTIGGTTPAAGTFTTFTSTGIDDNASSTALTIDASGRVGIGTSSPSQRLTVATGTNTDGAFNSAIEVGASPSVTQGGFIGSRTAAGNQRQGLYVSSSQMLTLWGDVAGDGNGVLDVVSGSSPSAGTDADSLFRIDSSGNVELKATNAKLILPSGGGIDFGTATTGTGTVTPTVGGLLDDYEEGTCSLSGTNWGSTTGNYTKIGNSVRVDAVATMTGTLGVTDGISGLPFVPSGYHSSTISVRDNSSVLRTVLCANVAFIGSTTRITSITGLSAPTTNDQLMISIIYRTT